MRFIRELFPAFMAPNIPMISLSVMVVIILFLSCQPDASKIMISQE
jgi:hypothetical protein